MSRHEPWSDKPIALLAQFPGPATLYPSKLKWVAIFSLVTFLLGCSILLLWPMLLHLSGKNLVVVVASFVGPVLMLIFVAIGTFGRDMPRVTLDAEGFEARHTLSRVYNVRWSEVAKFRSFLFLAFHVDTRPPQGRWDRFHRAYLGGHYMMWNDTFGLGAGDFVRLMNAWHERALAQHRSE